MAEPTDTGGGSDVITVENGSNNEVEHISLPTKIDVPIDGLTQDALDFINTLLFSYHFSAETFNARSPQRTDLIVLLIMLVNDSGDRSTVTKNIVEITGHVHATARASLVRFEELGYIKCVDNIGRSQLYRLTPELKTIVNEFSSRFWPHIEALRNEKERVKDLV